MRCLRLFLPSISVHIKVLAQKILRLAFFQIKSGHKTWYQATLLAHELASQICLKETIQLYISTISRFKHITNAYLNHIACFTLQIISFNHEICHNVLLRFINHITLTLQRNITKQNFNISLICNRPFFYNLEMWLFLFLVNYHHLEFFPLIYPVIRVILGLIDILSNPKYLFMRL